VWGSFAVAMTRKIAERVGEKGVGDLEIKFVTKT
jgi:hypothetical protein